MAGAVDAEGRARKELDEAARAMAALGEGDLPALAAKAGAVLAATVTSAGKVLFCGNGGSAADAQHLAAELVGRLEAGRDREALPGIALTTDTSILTAVANDFGYEEVFARQIAALGRPGDALVCLSTSGRSPNVIRAAEAARSNGVRVVALVGPDASPLDDLAEVTLHVPGKDSGQIQQGHITLGHLLCRLVDEAF